jgi:hypothetical protein
MELILMRLLAIPLNGWNLALLFLYIGTYYYVFRAVTLGGTATWQENDRMVVGINNWYLGTAPGRMVSDPERDRNLGRALTIGCCLLLISVAATFWLMVEVAWWLKLLILLGGSFVAATLGFFIGLFISPRVQRRYYDRQDRLREQSETVRIQEEQVRLIKQIMQDFGGEAVFNAILTKMDQKQQEQLTYNIKRAAEKWVKGYGSREAEIRSIYALCTQLRDGR